MHRDWTAQSPASRLSSVKFSGSKRSSPIVQHCSVASGNVELALVRAVRQAHHGQHQVDEERLVLLRPRPLAARPRLIVSRPRRPANLDGVALAISLDNAAQTRRVTLLRRRQRSAQRRLPQLLHRRLRLAHARGDVGRDDALALARTQGVEQRNRRRQGEEQLVRRRAVLDGSHPAFVSPPDAAHRVVATRRAVQLELARVEVGHVHELEPSAVGLAHAQRLRVYRQEGLAAGEQRAQRPLEDHLRLEVREVWKSMSEHGIAKGEVRAP
eukprot:scaffold5216_cov36-Phaeocystis_antarctica.AAC.1